MIRLSSPLQDFGLLVSATSGCQMRTSTVKDRSIADLPACMLGGNPEWLQALGEVCARCSDEVVDFGGERAAEILVHP